jgi:hypothetical protein
MHRCRRQAIGACGEKKRTSHAAVKAAAERKDRPMMRFIVLEVVSKPSIGPKIKAGCRFKSEE